MAEVEKWKQKKSVLETGRKVRKLNKVKNLLNKKMLMHTQQALKLREMLGQVDQGVAMLLEDLPKRPTVELDNQGED